MNKKGLGIAPAFVPDVLLPSMLMIRHEISEKKIEYVKKYYENMRKEYESHKREGKENNNAERVQTGTR